MATFVSSEDIGKGQQWRTTLTGALAESQRGIICLTPDNFDKPWVLFESGVLTKALERLVLYTLLVNSLDPRALSGSPLSQFQHTLLQKEDVLRLLESINSELGAAKRTSSGRLSVVLQQRRRDLDRLIAPLVLPKHVGDPPRSAHWRHQ